jgi:hypothetical protein
MRSNAREWRRCVSASYMPNTITGVATVLIGVVSLAVLAVR